MSRIMGVLLLAALAVGCSSTGRLAAPGVPFGGRFGANNLAAQKRTFERLVKEDPNNKFGWYNLGVIAQYQHDANALWYLGLALRMPHTKAADREATHFLNAALKLNPALGRALNTPSGTGRSGGSAPG